MTQVHSLIDAAVKVCGSRYALSKRIGVPESNLTRYASGERALTPRVAAKLADVVGIDAQRAACVAIIENEKDPNEREELKRVFFRGVGAVMSAFFTAVVLNATSPTTAEAASPSRVLPTTCDSLYIMSTLRAARDRLRSTLASLHDRLARSPFLRLPGARLRRRYRNPSGLAHAA